MMTKKRSTKSKRGFTEFTLTSNDPYDRHKYRLRFVGTDKAIIFDDYETMRVFWFQHSGMKRPCVVDVID
jgi:hypothetical protein